MLKIKSIILLIGDILILYFSLAITLSLRYQKIINWQLWQKHFWPFSLVFLTWVIIFFINRLYDLNTARNNFSFYNLWLNSLIWCAVIGFIFFYLITTGITPKTILILEIIIFGVLWLNWRKLFNYLLTSQKFTEKIIIIGALNKASRLAQQINQRHQYGFKVVGVLPFEINPINDKNIIKNKIQIIKTYNRLEQFVQKYKVKRIIIDKNIHWPHKLLDGLYKILKQGITIDDWADFTEKFYNKIVLDNIEQMWFLENIKENNKHFYEMTKRSLDIILSILLLIISLPFTPIIYLLIKLSSPGKVFFKQQRTGKLGKKFMAVKFRTMYQNAENNGPQWAQINDPRVTKIGKFLRKSRIDEIPQLINVLRGEMSFIGPRPERPEFIEKLKQRLPFYEMRLLIKPGITGWAQINFPYGASERDALEKLQYDLYYIKNRSIALDISILLKTIKTVLSGGGQ